jgi:hypothetical protein
MVGPTSGITPTDQSSATTRGQKLLSSTDRSAPIAGVIMPASVSLRRSSDEGSQMLTADWQVSGTYFEACNCEAICPCRSVHGQPGGPSTYGVCYGGLSWQIQHGHAGLLDLGGRSVVLSLIYADNVRPSTRWQVVLYVDHGADDDQAEALADIFLGRAGGTVSRLYGPAIGQVRAVRRARITLEHRNPRKRIDVVGYLTVEAEGAASDEGDVQCGIPGFDHPGTELYGDMLRSTDPALTWQVVGRRHASFATDFDYRSEI